jgi:hypothetical protein
MLCCKSRFIWTRAQNKKRAAKRAGKSLSGWLRSVIEGAPEGEWPGDFECLFGSIDDDRFVAPVRLKPEAVEE